MDRGRWIDARQHVDVALATIDEHRLRRLSRLRTRFRRGREARVARWQPRRAGPTADASDARPTVVHVRDPVAGSAGQAAPRQGVHGDDGPVDRSSPPSRDRRRPAATDHWAPSSTRSRNCARSSRRRHPQASLERRRSVPPSFVFCPTCRPTSRSVRSATGCSCRATRSARRSVRSIESWASRHAATRCNRRLPWACSAGRRLPRLLFQAPLRRRTRAPGRASGPRRRRTGARRPDTSTTSTSTISAAVAPAFTAASVSRPVRRLRASDRDQCREPDQRQRLRVEPTGHDPAGRLARFAEPSVVDRQQAQHIGVVHRRAPLAASLQIMDTFVVGCITQMT